MSDLYFIASEDQKATSDGLAILRGAEARHLTRVMRKKPGDEAFLFDGTGREYRSRITSIVKDCVELEILETREDDREPEIAVTALVALPKGERQKWALEKLTELGVRRFIPIDCERADVKFDTKVRERLERQALEASKQCGRLKLMTITSSIGVAELPALLEILDAKVNAESSSLSPDAEALRARLGDETLFDEFKPCDEVLRVIAHPLSDGDFGQRGFSELIRDLDGRVPRGALAMVGPAGGFSHSEVESAVAGGWTPLDLGRQVYRVETAALVAATLFLHLG
ncbi:MAG: RsmE family RNA methyltransferase [Thermoguttaceae bacterium]|jgi:16S rRNA (uracil1498-N3)-methyltransferase